TRRAAKTAILTTAGFADTLEIGRLTRQSTGLNEHEYTDSYLRNRHPAIVPRLDIYELAERVDARGEVVTPLDREAARARIREIAARGYESVAVCLLFSTLNARHELAVRAILQEEMPQAYVSLSHEVAPSVGEYARMSTTAANAALGPVAGNYLRALEETLAGAGLSVPILMMTCSGGVLPTQALNDRPVYALFSGPAACIKASQEIGRLVGAPNVLSTDIGGTSFDVGVIVDGAPMSRSELSIAGADLRVHSIDVQSIGAGGGSIAWLDEAGELKVGPHSAGASPGPACYGRGGVEPTATDADLVLGVLDPASFIGGAMRLDVEAARRALARIAEPLGLSVEHAAWGVRRILDSKMSDLLRRVTIEKGFDPKQFTLLANGGAGPSHAWAMARELGLASFVVPASATALSALGTAAADFQLSSERAAYVRLRGRGISAEEAQKLAEAAAGAVAEVRAQLVKAARTEPRTSLALAIRYLGQTHAIDTQVDADVLDAPAVGAALERFEAQYARRFGAAAMAKRSGFEILSVRATGVASLPPPTIASKGRTPERLGERAVYFDDAETPVTCAVWSADVPAEGWRCDGPAVIEFIGQTVLVPPGASAAADGVGNLHVRIQ
ncbi:MAG TPA: hydantoinase/oxoprolinase family protein, partial [Beijerinckiaceae bacterium]